VEHTLCVSSYHLFLELTSFKWELAAKDVVEPIYIFPQEDLAASLVDLYFKHYNVLTPLLHRPTFERKVAQGLHRRNASFGAVYLLVLAVGSRFSDDHRVCLEGQSEHSAGWKFFEQVQMVRKTLLGPPRLEDLQVHCVGVQAALLHWITNSHLAICNLLDGNFGPASMLDYRWNRYTSCAGRWCTSP
jgi:hypothetical protein